MGGAGRRGDMNAMLDALPALQLAELKAKDAIMVTTTVGSDPVKVTATFLLAGVEDVLRAAPTATRDLMSGWNMAAAAAAKDSSTAHYIRTGGSRGSVSRVRGNMLKFQRVLVVVLMAAAAMAQQRTGTLRGVLTDDSGAVIPAASISVSGNGAQHNAQTQADGSYTVSGLAPGQYTVHVAYPGFAPVDRSVNLSAGGNVQVPIQLSIVAEKQEVTVARRGRPHGERRSGQQRHRAGAQG